ncbi:hypothetical protein A5658_12930 [Mycobacterium sp. 1245111.1]|uniref:hypothetical protein n=1 Tax=Mycobacterium sp. 1245111.1 TaxID=1834073 RepID=UPI000800EF8F|nr:hypothetical protein [Mycobacterium sp. 1245111.1]OBK33747.1 hypothetical protein A5658_12930 [Mycobacterium sp. 1245111.1]
MVEYVLAEGEDASWITAAIYAVLFTGGGIALIVVGIRRRLARARWQRDDDQRLLRPGGAAESDDDRPPAKLPGGAWLIAAGAVMLVIWLGHVLHVVATLHLNGTI